MKRLLFILVLLIVGHAYTAPLNERVAVLENEITTLK